MLTFYGKSVTGGIAIGKIFVYEKEVQQIKKMKVTDTNAECSRFRNAQKQAIEQLMDLFLESEKKVGKAQAQIFETHRMILEDEGFVHAIEDLIQSQSVNAEHAVAKTADRYFQMFSAKEDELMKSRAADVRDVSERVLSILTGKERGVKQLEEPAIIVADDLSPSETVQMDRENILAFVTVHGSLSSHTAILAKTMNIPALIGTSIPLDSSMSGKMAALDGDKGILYVEPNEDVLASIYELREAQEEQKILLQTLIGKENKTKDGRKIELYANIGNSKDLDLVIKNDAGGIGLFRSEFLFLQKDHFPTEEEQFIVYKEVLQAMAGKKVVFRTLDIGADKQVPYFDLDQEENPAMGFRAIRICLNRPDIFKTQLRALLRASVYGNAAVMYPMIISLDEIQRIKRIVEEVKAELKNQGIAYADMEQGIMIETPAAAIMSDELAKEVDFFSIGTNDLTQYTLAIDRQNVKLLDYYDPHHPAILRLIQTVTDNAHKAGIWVGICGELAADTSLTGEFLKMGVDELSVSSGKILSVRKVIRETDTELSK